MATTADRLTALVDVKDKLVHNLEVQGQVPQNKTFSELVDMPFDPMYDTDDGIYMVDGFPIDLATWTEPGSMSLIYSNAFEGIINLQVGTTSGNYRVIVNDGVNDISNTTYARGTQANISVTKGNGDVYYAIKISPAVAGQSLTYCRYVKPTSFPMTYYNIGLILAYINTDTFTTLYSAFNHAGSTKSPLFWKFYIKSTKNVTEMTYMCYDCRGLKVISCPNFDTSKVTTFSYCFYQCNLLKSVPMTMTTNIATDVGGLFNACYSLRKIPDLVFREDVAVNFSTTFASCYSLEVFPTRMNTSKSTSLDNTFSSCYHLRKVPEGFSSDNATTLNGTFLMAVNLIELPNLNTSKVTNMNNVFNGARNLKKLPVFSDYTKVTAMNGFLTDTIGIVEPYTLDLSTCLTTLTMFVSTTANSLRGLIVNPLGTWTGTSPQIDIYSSGLDRTALVALFNSLGTVTGKTIRITNSLGASSLTAADLLIATNKGWTVNKTT